MADTRSLDNGSYKELANLGDAVQVLGRGRLDSSISGSCRRDPEAPSRPRPRLTSMGNTPAITPNH